jgi:hypothetical protein
LNFAFLLVDNLFVVKIQTLFGYLHRPAPVHGDKILLKSLILAKKRALKMEKVGSLLGLRRKWLETRRSARISVVLLTSSMQGLVPGEIDDVF